MALCFNVKFLIALFFKVFSVEIVGEVRVTSILTHSLKRKRFFENLYS